MLSPEKITKIFLIKFIFAFSLLYGQKPTIQDCLGAIPVCTEIYEEKNAPTGDGNYHNEINGFRNGGFSCMDAETNSIWYTFTVNSSGDFGFVLTPNDLNDDYDWALYDITHARCQDIFHLNTLEVSCNAAGSNFSDGFKCNGVTGANGKSNHTVQGGGCSSFPPDRLSGFSPHNDFVPVLKGNTYVLVVSNWTGSRNGYTIDFSPSGDLGIFDNEAPEIISVDPPFDCQVDSFNLEFSENIQLSSIGNKNFVLQGPDGAHAVLVTSNAHTVQGNYDKYFTLRFSPAISATGTYNLEVKLDGQTDFLDLCGNPMQNAMNFGFEIGQAPLLPPDLGPDTLICDGSTLQLNISNPRSMSYLWSDGSSLPVITITESGFYTATIRNDCGAVQNSISVDFANCDSCLVYVPNAFTPNSDGMNDVLQVFADCNLQEFSIHIYDRWGSLISQSTSMDNAWDGMVLDEMAPNGVYVYVLKYQVQELGDVFFRTVSGDVAIIR